MPSWFVSKVSPSAMRSAWRSDVDAAALVRFAISAKRLEPSGRGGCVDRIDTAFDRMAWRNRRC